MDGFKIQYWTNSWTKIKNDYCVASSIEAAWRYAELHKPCQCEHIRVKK